MQQLGTYSNEHEQEHQEVLIDLDLHDAAAAAAATYAMFENCISHAEIGS